MNMRRGLIHVVAVSLLVVQLCGAEECGIQAGNAMCGDGSCCSQWGFCGNTTSYCGPGCQSNCRCIICEDDTSTTLAAPTSTGQASYYTKFGPGGNGSPNIWNEGRNCGKWFKIKCTGHGCTSKDTISVKIVDRCANGCRAGGAFDLSFTAFKAIADPIVEIINVEYAGPYDSP